MKPVLNVRYSDVALKDLTKLDRTAAARILAKIELYAETPQALANQVKKLKGSDYLRLRVGDYRVVFTQDGLVMEIARIGHRKEIYD